MIVGWLLGAPAAWSAVAEVLPVESELFPFRQSTFEIAVFPADAEPPSIVFDGARATPLAEARHGVWTTEVTPLAAGGVVTASWADQQRFFPVILPGAPDVAIEVEGRVLASQGAFSLTLRGADLRPEEWQLTASEGQIVSVANTRDGLAFVHQLEASPYPRTVVVSAVGPKSGERPLWLSVPVLAEISLPFDVEPDATIEVEVGDRRYGPVVADAGGQAILDVQQGPEDHTARVIVRDTLGNRANTELLLTRQESEALHAVTRPTGSLYVAPTLFLKSLTGDAPHCDGIGAALGVSDLGQGEWMVAAPGLARFRGQSIVCAVSGSAPQTFYVGPDPDTVARVGLRADATRLRPELPRTEFQMALENVLGDRLPVHDVALSAGDAVVEIDPSTLGQTVVRGTFIAPTHVGKSEYGLEATYAAPVGDGPAVGAHLAWEPFAVDATTVHLSARALNRVRRGVAGQAVRIGLLGEEATVVTDDQGWATAVFDVRSAGAPLPVTVEVGGRSFRHLLVPGATEGVPRILDYLKIEIPIAVAEGRVAGVSVTLDPPLLRAGPGALSWVVVRVDDAAGNPVTDVPLDAFVAPRWGEVSPFSLRSDGTWVAQFTPKGVESSGDVPIRVTADGVSSSATVTVEPRVVRAAFGPWVGASTNFGAISSLTVGGEFDIRVRNRWLGERWLFRAGLYRAQFSQQAQVSDDLQTEFRSLLLPLQLGPLHRWEGGRRSVWMGGGLQVAYHDLSVLFDDVFVGSGTNVLLGPWITLGAAFRTLGGEFVVDVRLHSARSRAEDLGYSGDLGGLSTGVGYRILY